MKNLLRNSYFGRLFYKSKVLFWIIFLFFAFSVLANLFRLNVTPFFIWSVYSERHPPQEAYRFYEVRYNDHQRLSLPHTWDQMRNMMLYDPLAFYISVRVRGREDYTREVLEGHWAKKYPFFAGYTHRLYPGATAFDAFPIWYKRYLSLQTGVSARAIHVLEKNVKYTPEGRLEEISSDTVLHIP